MNVNVSNDLLSFLLENFNKSLTSPNFLNCKLLLDNLYPQKNVTVVLLSETLPLIGKNVNVTFYINKNFAN